MIFGGARHSSSKLGSALACAKSHDFTTSRLHDFIFSKSIIKGGAKTKRISASKDRDSLDMVKPIGLLHVDNGQTVRGGTLYALTSSLVDDDATGGEVFGHHVGTGLRQLVVEFLVTLG